MLQSLNSSRGATPARCVVLLALLAPLVLPYACLRPAWSETSPAREEVLRTLRRAVEFYRTRVSTQGGYHFAYAEDLSFGRSEHGEGPTQVEVQRDGTPLVGMAYLEVYEATGDRYYLEAARETAHALVRGQLCSGGWDYLIEFDAAKRKLYPYRADGNCAAAERPATTLDDNVTQAAVRLLVRVDRELGFKDEKIHEAARFSLDSLLKSQYPNGAWPQRYSKFTEATDFPVMRASYPDSWARTWPGGNYYAHYTFNDNSIVDMIDTMLEAARTYNEPRYRASAEKGGDFILLAQMPDPQPGWAQQYDRDMHPAWARRFEPPSITGGESQSIMKILLVLYRETGSRKYLEPLSSALEYYRRSALPEVSNGSISETRRRACPPGSICLARFYELRTNRPLYISKGTRVTAQNQPAAIIDGYDLSYSDASVITHYSVLVNGNLLREIEREYQEIQKADPAMIRRPDRLHGLSPWSGKSAPVGSGTSEGADREKGLEAKVRDILGSMDPRGAWVEEGSVGKAGRIVSLFAAGDLVVKLRGKTYPMKENDTLEVFAGAEPPRERIIRSRTFAENVKMLAGYVTATRAP